MLHLILGYYKGTCERNCKEKRGGRGGRGGEEGEGMSEQMDEQERLI